MRAKHAANMDIIIQAREQQPAGVMKQSETMMMTPSVGHADM